MDRETQRYKDAMDTIRNGKHSKHLLQFLQSNLGISSTTKAREASGRLSADEKTALTVIRAVMGEGDVTK